MSSSGPKTPRAPSWLLELFEKGEVPDFFADPEHFSACLRLQQFIDGCTKISDSYADGRSYEVLLAEAFSKRASALEEVSTGETNWRLAQQEYVDFRLAYWFDQIEIASLANHLAFTKGYALLLSFVRSADIRDCIGMSLSARALLELGVAHADYLRNPLGVFRKFAGSGNLVESEQLGEWLEKPLVRAVWGTRLGSSDLGDGMRGSPATRLWEFGPIDGVESAKNILSEFQRRARVLSGGLGITEFRVYEVLCDVVHPAALGNQLFLRDINWTSEDTYSATIAADTADGVSRDYVAIAATFAVCQGLALLIEIHERLKFDLAECRNHLQRIRREILSQ